MNTVSNITACRGSIQKWNFGLATSERTQNHSVITKCWEHRFTVWQQSAEERTRPPRDVREEHKITGQYEQYNLRYIRVTKTTVTRAEYAARVGENVNKPRDMDIRGRIIVKWKADWNSYSIKTGESQLLDKPPPLSRLHCCRHLILFINCVGQTGLVHDWCCSI